MDKGVVKREVGRWGLTDGLRKKDEGDQFVEGRFHIFL